MLLKQHINALWITRKVLWFDLISCQLCRMHRKHLTKYFTKINNMAAVTFKPFPQPGRIVQFFFNIWQEPIISLERVFWQLLIPVI